MNQVEKLTKQVEVITAERDSLQVLLNKLGKQLDAERRHNYNIDMVRLHIFVQLD